MRYHDSLYLTRNVTEAEAVLFDTLDLLLVKSVRNLELI